MYNLSTTFLGNGEQTTILPPSPTNFPATNRRKFFINPTLMLPVSDHPSPEKPKTPTKSLDRKNSFSLSYIQTLLYHPRSCLVLLILILQILILYASLSLPISSFSLHRPFPAPISVNTDNDTSTDDVCNNGKVYIYDIPTDFNTKFLENCDELSPWGSRCGTFSNNGFGKKFSSIFGVVPKNVANAWYWTDQFALEIIYHNRMMNYKCRTMKPESATAFYIPFYAGLAVGKYLWSSNYTSKDRDYHCDLILKWVQEQPYWNRSNGWDHFITMGRITWDFRRSKDGDWGSRCIYLPGMRNITRLLIERNSWDYFDVGVPYPTGFHPSSANDIKTWQDFVNKRRRSTLYCFAGATRGFIKHDFRGLLLKQCYADSEKCRVVDCGGSKCSNGTAAILETFLNSDFCLQPRGDSFTRRSIFDCMVAGSIPVFFWKRTAYYQYEWFLPDEPGSYSVFIDRNEVENGTSIRSVLEKFSKEEVKKMRAKVVEYIPKLVYAKPNEGLKGMKDAFDVAVEGVLKRVKEQEGGYKWK